MPSEPRLRPTSGAIPRKRTSQPRGAAGTAPPQEPACCPGATAPSPSGLVAEGLEDPAHGQGGRERSTVPGTDTGGGSEGRGSRDGLGARPHSQGAVCAGARTCAVKSSGVSGRRWGTRHQAAEPNPHYLTVRELVP